MSRYNVIVYAGGTTGTGVPPEPISDWVRAGGTLITLGSGTDWAVARDIVALDRHTLDVDSLVADYAYADLSRARGSKRLAGATIRATLDTTHPIAYGLSANIPVFRTRTTLYDPSSTPGATVGRYDTDPILSGYVPRELQNELTGKMVIATERLGSGRVIMFADNPTFRGFWFGTNMALLNAIFLHKAI